MNLKSSFAKMIYGSSVCAGIGVTFVWNVPIDTSLWKDIFIIFVTFSVPLAGFLLTVLTIFAAFSGTAYMKRLFQATKTFTNVMESFLAAVIINLCLAIISVIGMYWLPIPGAPISPLLIWIQSVCAALFMAGICCTVICVYYLRIILQGIMKG